MTYYHRKDCRLCFSKNLNCIFELKPTVLADAFVEKSRLSEVQERYPRDLFLCLDCGHVQLLDVVSADAIYRNYLYETSTSLGLVAHFKRFADEMVGQFHLGSHSLVVDIGSNDGSLIGAFRELGTRVIGVDPARDVASRATAMGLPTVPEYFTAVLAQRLREQFGPADLITANNVFAHADNLNDMLQGVRDWLSSDGVFSFEVSYLPDIFERSLFDTIYHEHLCYHSLNPLLGFLERGGLEIFDVKHLPTKGGSLRVLAQPIGGPRALSREVSSLANWEREQGWHRPETFRPFVDSFEQKRKDLVRQLEQWKAQGKEIIGYGASHTVTTLLGQWELGSFFSCLVDDNPRKHDLFSPLDHLPVYSSQILEEKLSAIVVILAWQYADTILQKHQRFLQRGGIFCKPLPRCEIVTA